LIMLRACLRSSMPTRCVLGPRREPHVSQVSARNLICGMNKSE
jgi:hypothetical protein